MKHAFFVIASFVAAICLTVPSFASTAIPKGATLQTQLASGVNSATLKPGDTISFVVVAPYPQDASGLAGATIVADVTDVAHAKGDARARVGFLFDHIQLKGGGSQPIAAFVQSSAVVRQGGTSQSSSEDTLVASQLAAAVPPGMAQTNNSDTVFWQHKLGKSAPATNRRTGGIAYARKRGGQIKLAAGTPVTLQLASPLTLP